MMISAEDLFDYHKLTAFNARLTNVELAEANPISISEVEAWITAHLIAIDTFGMLGPEWVREQRLGPQLTQVLQNYKNFAWIREDLITRLVWYLDVYERLIAPDPESERVALRRRRVLGDGLPGSAESPAVGPAGS
jgi:hypothetical protein